MNKADFIKTLSHETGFDEAKCTKINNILEDTFIIGKHRQEELVNKFETELDMSQAEADHLYNTVMGIIGASIKDKLKHPFGAED